MLVIFYLLLFVYYIIRPTLLLLHILNGVVIVVVASFSCYIVLGRNSIDSVVAAVAVVFVLHFHFVVYFFDTVLLCELVGRFVFLIRCFSFLLTNALDFHYFSHWQK